MSKIAAICTFIRNNMLIAALVSVISLVRKLYRKDWPDFIFFLLIEMSLLPFHVLLRLMEPASMHSLTACPGL